jgi:uncharacterized protein YjbI with pentapeptide repeats/uncharacterized membrane protein
VFCEAPGCHKALGEFRYSAEALAERERWHTALADRVTAFIAHPVYIVVHVVWFALWVAVNTGLVLAWPRFDAYPFALLGILLAVEAIFITGFVLISQTRQGARADLRAELDYEVNVRTYRELTAMHASLRAIAARRRDRGAPPRHERGDAASPGARVGTAPLTRGRGRPTLPRRQRPQGGLMLTVRRWDTGATIAELAGDVLARAPLAGMVLLYADLRAADLRGADLRGTDLCQSDLRDATLAGATLIGADVTLADLEATDLSGSSLGDARLQAINRRRPGPMRTAFAGADLTRATLKNSNLSAGRFESAILRRADLTRCDLRGADFTGADLTDATLAFANLTGAVLRHATLVGATLTGAVLDGADLRHADLSLATLNGVRLTNTDLTDSLWSRTAVATCVDLHTARGLGELRFGEPSGADLASVRGGLDVLPDELLVHLGFAPAELRALRALRSVVP